MYTDEDRRRLLESRHDLAALENPTTLTDDPDHKQALVASRAELLARRDALRSAASLVSKEKSETDVERAGLQGAVTALLGKYRFVRGKVEDALLNVDPDSAPPPAEMLRRTRLFDRVFRHTLSDLVRSSQRSVVEMLGGVAEALAGEKDLAPLGYAAPFAAAHAAAEAVAAELDRETGEDTAAMTALRAAREELDRASHANALLVESVLVRASREAELGRFVLAQDAAYAARRAARVPIQQEEGAGAIDTEPPPA